MLVPGASVALYSVFITNLLYFVRLNQPYEPSPLSLVNAEVNVTDITKNTILLVLSQGSNSYNGIKFYITGPSRKRGKMLFLTLKV